MNKTLRLGEVMTVQPHSVDPQQKVSDAKQMMVKHAIKHLPVVKNTSVVGILTDRDIKLRQAVSQKEDFHSTALVEDVCVTDPYTMRSNAPLTDALRGMVEKRIGSTIVVDEDHGLLGIFTSMDACRVLLGVLQQES